MTVVSAERQVRGTVERTNTLDAAAADVGPDDTASRAPSEHRGPATAFVAGLLAEYEWWVNASTDDAGSTGQGYTHMTLRLDESARTRLLDRLQELLAPHLEEHPSGHPDELTLALLLIPAAPRGPSG